MLSERSRLSITPLFSMCIYATRSKYVEETIKLLPEKPEPILLAKIRNQVASLGRIHAAQPSFSFA